MKHGLMKTFVAKKERGNAYRMMIRRFLRIGALHWLSRYLNAVLPPDAPYQSQRETG
jgi:hypothetical protein